VKIRPFEELIAGDRRTRRFAPGGGLDTRGLYDVRVTADAMQRSIASLELVPAVPDVVRDRFAVLQLLHTCGTFAYEFFGVAVTEAHLLYETALGARFTEYFDGHVPLVRPRVGVTVTLDVPNFGELQHAMRRGFCRYWRRAKHHDGWHIEGFPQVDLSLPALLSWAYDVGLLTSWLDARWAQAYGPLRVMAQTSEQHLLPKGYWAWSADRQNEWWGTTKRRDWDRENLDVIAQMRNHLAHPSSPGLGLPGDSSMSLKLIADFVNCLWTSTADRRSAITLAPPVLDWLKLILEDVRDILTQRMIWRAVRRIVESNPTLQEDDTFHRWMDAVYARTVAAGVRRQVDSGPEVLSLLRLLETLGAHPEFVTRQRHVAFFLVDAPAEDGEGLERTARRLIGNETFDRLAGQGSPHYDPTADIARLRAGAQPIRRYVNEHVAHASESKSAGVATYDELDAALDVIDELTRKVHVLLTGDDLAQIVPVWQYDWTRVFESAWRPG
jgi:hypothetical protein